MIDVPLFDNKPDQTGYEEVDPMLPCGCAICGRPISQECFDNVGQCGECGRLRYNETRIEFESIFEGIFEDDRCNWWMDL